MMTPVKRLLFFTQVLQICTATVTSLVAQNGPMYFYTTGFPYNYQSNMNDTWVLRARGSDYVVSSQVIATHIESSPSCQWDNVTFYDGNSVFSRRLNFFCGYERPWITSSGQHMTVHFMSDNSIQKMGFKAKFWCILKSGEGISVLALSENEFWKTGTMLAVITLLMTSAALGIVCYKRLATKSVCVCHMNKVDVFPV